MHGLFGCPFLQAIWKNLSVSLYKTGNFSGHEIILYMDGIRYHWYLTFYLGKERLILIYLIIKLLIFMWFYVLFCLFVCIFFYHATFCFYVRSNLTSFYTLIPLCAFFNCHFYSTHCNTQLYIMLLVKLFVVNIRSTIPLSTVHIYIYSNIHWKCASLLKAYLKE